MPPSPRPARAGAATALAIALLLSPAPASAQPAPPRAATAAQADPDDLGEVRLRGGRAGASRPSRRAPATTRPVRGVLRPALAPERFAPRVRAAVATLPDPLAPAAPKRRKLVEEDPYSPLGLRLGGLTLLPALEQSAGFDSNPNRVARPAKGSAVYRTEGELRLRSDWSRHALTGDLRGAYSLYPDVAGADRPEGAGRLNLQLDASRDTAIDLETRFQIDTERPGSPEFNQVVRDRPVVASAGASAGVTQRFNRFSLGLKGGVDRKTYEDAEAPDGTIIDQGDRDVTQTGLRLRAGYELTPGVQPFVEAEVDRRQYEREIDRSGLQRSSDGLGAKVGTSFELTRLLTGEVAAGYQKRRYDDPALRDLDGPIAEAALAWSVSPLTTLRLRASSQIGETTILGANGTRLQAATLELQHDLRRNLTLTGALTLSRADYDGIVLREDALIATARMDYRLTRWMALRASFSHERLESTAAGSGYTANIALFGVRFTP